MKCTVFSFLAVLFLLCSCTDRNKAKEPHFNSIDYSYDDSWETSFSVRIDNEGNLILAKGRPEKYLYYSSHLDPQVLNQLDSILNQISILSLDTVYMDRKSDQSYFKVDFILNDKRSKYYVYGDSGPKELMGLNALFQNIIESERNIVPLDTTITFRSLERFYPQK